MEDKKSGISVRFVQSYDPKADTMTGFVASFDRAWILAMSDKSDRPFADKLLDAQTFLKLQVH